MKFDILLKNILLSFVSALLLNLSYPPFNLWLLAWVSFLPLFIALKNKTAKQVFSLAYLTGVFFWSGNIYWLVHVTLLGTVALVLFLALYFGVFGLAFRALGSKPSTLSFFAVASFWVFLEYSRSYLLPGFPWSLLAFSQTSNLPIIQIADITGAWGVSFLVMFGNMAVYSYRVPGTGHRVKIRKILTFLLCLIIVLLYGYFRLYRTTYGMRPTTTKIKVSVVQGNIPQELKWSAGAEGYIIEKYLGLSAEAAKDNPDLIIWPEASLPVVLEEEPEYFEKVKSFNKNSGVALILGAVTQRQNLYYNSAVFVSGENFSIYDKLHLVPFGEYIPLKKYFPFLETIAPIGEIERGKSYTLFNLSKNGNYLRCATLICFEDLFPELARKFTIEGADFLINITNDAWYKKSTAPYQHFQASVFRAVENRRIVVRAANTGISGFISPQGKSLLLVKDTSGKEIFVDGIGSFMINPANKGLTFYSRYGDVFVYLALLIILYAIIARPKFIPQSKKPK